MEERNGTYEEHGSSADNNDGNCNGINIGGAQANSAPSYNADDADNNNINNNNADDADDDDDAEKIADNIADNDVQNIADNDTKKDADNNAHAHDAENDDENAEVEAVLSQIFLRDKLSLITGRTFWSTTARLQRRFGLPSIRLGDGPHGVRKPLTDNTVLEAEPATCFPTAAALACSWNTSLLRKVGTVLGIECLHHEVAVLLSPGMNLQRHPCGGRNFEYFSEDPYLTGRMAAALVEGIQSCGVGACAKHIAVNNQEKRRFVMDAIVDPRTLRELYLRAFEHVLKTTNPWTVMCAYNRLNGEFCSQHSWLFRKVVREEWGYDGVVVTDWGAADDRARGLSASVDLDMPASYGCHKQRIQSALSSGDLSMKDLDECVRRMLRLLQKAKQTKMPSSKRTLSISRRLSWEPPTETFRKTVDWVVHNESAYHAALECAVLLKNNDEFLPLNTSDLKKDAKLAVIGAFAKTPRFQGMGSSEVFIHKRFLSEQSLWPNLAQHVAGKNLIFAPGFDLEKDYGETIDEVLIDEAIKVAKSSDFVILVTGLPAISESEAFDREFLGLPEHYNALIAAVCQANPNTVVVLNNGSPVAMPWVDGPKAIVEGFLLGQAGGRAITDLLFGVHSFSGKLAATFAHKLSDIPAAANFGDSNTIAYREGLHVGYRYFSAPYAPSVLFPFGHGLTYTTFEYRDLVTKVEKDVGGSNGLHKEQILVNVQFMLANTGTVEAAEVSQCYVHAIESKVHRAEIELQGFQKIRLKPGESQLVVMSLNFDSFAFYDIGVERWVVEPGVYEIRIGSSSADIRLSSEVQLLSGSPASQLARDSYPPSSVPVADDDTFAARMCVGNVTELLEQSLQNVPDIINGPINRNSVLGDLQDYAIGRMFRRIMLKGTLNQLPNQYDPKQIKVAQAVRDNLPLRGLVLFGKGALSFATLDRIIGLMNGQRLCCCCFSSKRRNDD